MKQPRLIALLVLLVLLAACQPLPEELPTPTPIPTPASSSKPVYTVKRGPIVDQLKLLGRVAAVQEQQLYFKQSGRVRAVNVTVNQQVKQGDILAQLETGQLETQIKQAQINVDIANLKLQQAQSKDKGVDLLQSEAQVNTAAAALSAAQAKLESLLSGADATDLRAAESAVSSAKVALQNAQAKLAQLKANAGGTSDMKAAQSAVDSAKVALQNAQTKLAQLKVTASATTTNPDIKAAEAAVAQQQAKVDQLTSDLAKLQAGHTQEELTIASANLEKAKANLQQKQADYDKVANRADIGALPQATALQQATIDYNVAKAQLDQLLKSDPTTIAAAQQNLDAAKSQLASLQAKLDQLKAQAPTQASNDIASQEAAVATAQAAYDTAVAKLNQLKAQAPSDISTQEAAVATAQAAYDSAQAKLDQLTRGANDTDIATAKAAIAAAQANYELAKTTYQQKVSSADATDFDALILAKQVESAQLQLDYLKQTLEEQTIRAPFDGIITQIASTSGGKPGDQVQAFAVVLVMANPQNIEVAVELNDSDVSRIGLGMPATINSDRLPGQPLTGKVRALPGDLVSAPNSRPQIRISFDKVPKLDVGGIVNVVITAQKKDNVLLVPNSVIRSFAGRRYVQVVDSSGRKREVDVEIGIVGPTDTEVVSGLKEGDQVLGQ